MCKRALVFAGTLEGRTISEYLASQGIKTYVCVATSYGESLFPKVENLVISSERLTLEEMERYIEEVKPQVVLDATHPYAAVVTENIKQACENTQYPYVRLLRSSGKSSESNGDNETVYVDNIAQAVDYLQTTEGNILLTTGSKDLKEFTRLDNYKERLYARVLSLPNVVKDCADLGFEGKHLICMQGPFSYEMNRAMLNQFGAKYLVTKESGSPGGFVEKYEAAVDNEVKLIIIGRPIQENGLNLGDCKRYLQSLFQIKNFPKISLVGIGMGSEKTLTLEAKEALTKAQLIIGASRMVEAVALEHQVVYKEYDPVKIKTYLIEHSEFDEVAIALSGDVGFFSGAKKLLEELKVFQQEGNKIQVISGISSVVYFCGKISKSWEDVKMSSLHGQEENVIGLVQNYEKVFVVVGNKDGVKNLAKKLTEYQMDQVNLYIGERLSYPEEKIITGKPEDFIFYHTDSLSVVLIENEKARNKVVTHGIADEEFIRDKVPMTKEEVRSISLSKLRLQADSVVYDIGAGSGSVSVEMARCAYKGKVYAIERKPQAAQLIQENKRKFVVDNLEVVEGLAPEVLEGLPVPTHAFIGGSAGNLKDIMESLLEKNPKIRIVLNAITLETVAESLDCLKWLSVTDVEIVNVSVSKARELQEYHLMMGQNPVYIISCTGGIKQ